MTHVRDDRPFFGLRAAVAVATVFAIGAISISTQTTEAGASATDPAAAASGNGPTGYFPAQFVNEGAEITEHIEAF